MAVSAICSCSGVAMAIISAWEINGAMGDACPTTEISRTTTSVASILTYAVLLEVVNGQLVMQATS